AHAIDDHGFGGRRRVLHCFARGREEADRPERIEKRVFRQIEFVEGVGREHARAVDRLAARRMLLEERDGSAAARQLPAGVEACGPSADNDDILNGFHPGGASIIRSSFAPRTTPAWRNAVRATRTATRRRAGSRTGATDDRRAPSS